MVKVYFADTGVLNSDALFSEFYNRISKTRQEKIDRLRFQKDRNLSLGVSLLLNAGLLEYGLCEKDMTYLTSENGKPFFKDHPEICFNLSHSGTKVMAVFSDREVGCDVEKKTEANQAAAKRFFTKEEYETLTALSDPALQTDLFFRIWTRKESFVKALGRGFSLSPNAFAVADPKIKDPATGKNFAFLDCDLFADYFASVCVESPEEDMQSVRLCKKEIDFLRKEV